MSEAANKRALDAVVREAKTDLAPNEPDWSAMEARLMARVAAEKQVAPVAYGKVAGIAALVFAAAAAVALVVKEPAQPSPRAAAVADAPAGSLLATEGGGEVRIGGTVASAGRAIAAGDRIEASHARAFFERPRKVSWLLEHDAPDAASARADVKAAGETLVLGLDDGAIEAQVTPVPSGEAFAVDVAEGSKLVRVAVHGTHLRVTRRGSHVTVDLTEGVVSIGTPPSTGSTYGTLVTAPAHVELDVNDVEHSLSIDHAPSSVRDAIPLGEGRSSARPTTAANTPPAATESPSPAQRPAPAAMKTADPTPSSALAAPPVPPRDAIVAAVRSCAASLVKGGDVTVTVNSTLKLKTGASGEVLAARFDPPLSPDVQACAAGAIYKVTLANEASSSVELPITYTTK